MTADETEVVRKIYQGSMNSAGMRLYRDPARIAANDVLFAHANPDLTKFCDHGGKLIIFHGWNDSNNIPPELAVDYHRLVQGTMGGAAAAAETARLFMLPGAYHCRYGEGGGEVDWLRALEDWVEKGRAPDDVLAYRMQQEPYVSIPVAGDEQRNLLMPRHPLSPDSYDRVRPVHAYPGGCPLPARRSGTGGQLRA